MRPCARTFARAAFVVCWILAVSDGVLAAEDPPVQWRPESQYTGAFDWVQMTSGEWVKGDIIVLYDGDLEFSSDEFGTLFLDWQNVRQIRTAQTVNVRLSSRRTLVGKLVLVGTDATIYGAREVTFAKGDVLTITAGAPRERDYWDMELFVGVVLRSGNTEVREFNFQGEIQRRTTRNRFLLDMVVNENTTEDVQVSSNQRVGAKWDLFVKPRLFVSVLGGEYFRDPFQNIRSRYTVASAVGYQLRDSPRTEWNISGGVGYQQTRFESVATLDDEVDTPVLICSTRAEVRLTNWLEFDGLYRLQVVNEASGIYNHHALVSFETSVTDVISFDLSLIWDRIRDPRPAADGQIPDQDDYRTTAGLSFEF